MWPFVKSSSEPSQVGSPQTESPQTEASLRPSVSRSTKDDFLNQNASLLIQKLLRDAFSYGLAFSKTPVPLYPTFNTSLGKAEGNWALSLFELCERTLQNGNFQYTYLRETHAGYSTDRSLSPDYPFFEAKSPFWSESAPRFTDLIRVPLGILYEIHQSFVLKQKLYRDKLILYVDGLRHFGNQTSASFVDVFRDSVKAQAKEIFSDSRLWIFDAGDRLEQPVFVSPEIQTSIDFAYSEISRILGIPQTHLLGKSPDGQNATGRLDEENYQKVLRGLLDSLILPLLRVGDPTYSAPHSLKMAEVAQTLQILESLQSASNGLSDAQKQSIRTALFSNLDL